MTISRSSYAALLLGLPLCAWGLELRDQPVHSALVVPTITLPAEPTEQRPMAPSLRDALRLPASYSESAVKPFRLTPQERQRLREQLRGVPLQAERSQ